MYAALSAPPGDGISSIQFAPNESDMLLVASWDSTMRLYDVANNLPRHTFNMNGPNLCCCFDNTGDFAFAGGVDSNVHMLDIAKGTSSLMKSHSLPVADVDYCSNLNLMLAKVSGSWDGILATTDKRAPHGCSSTQLEGKIYSLSLSGYKAVVATSAKKIFIFDLRNMVEPEQVRDSPLKCQIRKVSCSPDGESFAVTSVEAKIAIEYLNLSTEAQSKKYQFKCHRVGDVAYPINDIAYHPVYGTFASGGCDGIVNFWDGNFKKRLNQLPPFHTSISSLSFNRRGNLLAIAASYTFEQGEKLPPPLDNIYIKHVDDLDVKPRDRA